MTPCPQCGKTLAAHLIEPRPKGAHPTAASSFEVRCDTPAPDDWWTVDDVRALLRDLRRALGVGRTP